MTVSKDEAYTSRVRLAPACATCIAIVATTLTVASSKDLWAQSREYRLVVTVLDSENSPVQGLNPVDFVVREDNVRREVLRVNHDTGPRQIAVLIDTSAAARTAIVDFRRGVSAFIEAMAGENEISIISFGGVPRILATSTRELPRLKKGLGQVFSDSTAASYLLDAMVETANGFTKGEASRPLMVILSTEGLDHSHDDSRRVLDKLQESGAAVYTVVLRDRGIGQPFSQWKIERDLALTRGPLLSGGERRDLLTSTGTESALNEIANELLHQYLVVYSRPNTLIPPKNIEVSVTRNGLSVRGTPVKATR